MIATGQSFVTAGAVEAPAKTVALAGVLNAEVNEAAGGSAASFLAINTGGMISR